LTEKIASVEDCVDLIELRALEVEIFSGARNVCIIEVGSVEVVDLVDDRQRGFPLREVKSLGSRPTQYMRQT